MSDDKTRAFFLDRISNPKSEVPKPSSLPQTVIQMSENEKINIPTQYLKTIIKYGIKDLFVPLEIEDFYPLINPPDNINSIVNRICYRSFIPFEEDSTKLPYYGSFIPSQQVSVEEHGIQEYMVALMDSTNDYFRSHLPMNSKPDLELYLHALISTMLDNHPNIGCSLLLSTFRRKLNEETEPVFDWVNEYLNQPDVEDNYLSEVINKVFQMNAPEDERMQLIDIYKIICKDAVRLIKDCPEFRYTQIREVTALPEILKLVNSYNSFNHDNF
ncbi:uncharacterized protein SAPINGB_P005523 [Magnusiomyces paraingens]|uniref:Uncharacterized protein n=1 Tax=Magnusiomyces paraingens TaxID=2606893 RepID=A0A5E8C5E7_9ASCO|nr:uncharacterized protein SAPINGB_P005523 [Saprochaete ingens]VVT57078.1 unnamed protein product [Saprochaete ingens]